MKRVTLDKEAESIKKLFSLLTADPDGSVVELDGLPVARVLPIPRETPSVDDALLRAAILHRRDESREQNTDWEEADRQIWNGVEK